MGHEIDTEKWLRECSRSYHARGVSRSEKTALRKEMQRVTGWHAKSVLRVLGRKPHLQPEGLCAAPVRTGRPRKLSGAGGRALCAMWRMVGRPSGERLWAMLPDLVVWAVGEVPGFTEAIGRELLSVSASTVERRLREHRPRRKRRSATRAASGRARQLSHLVEVSTSRPGDSPPGWFDMDTVSHCGGDAGGEFTWTLNATDVHSGWAHIRTIPRCGAGEVVLAFRRMVETSALPFLHIHFDNGGEFLNHQLFKVCAHRGIGMSRSRPGKSNDNPRVEQKNFIHVRAVFGYGRLEAAVLEQMNRINDLHMLLINLFGVSGKLQSKTRHGAKVRRVHDRPKTPLQRVIDHHRRGGLPVPAGIAALAERKKNLNPFRLHRELTREIAKLEQLRRRHEAKSKKEKIYA